MTRDIGQLDRARIRQLFDLRSAHNVASGGGYRDDPYPAFHRLRESGPVHAGVVHELLGYAGPAVFQGLPFSDRPHFSAFSFASCDRAFRDDVTFASSPGTVDPLKRSENAGVNMSILTMGGKEHRRFRGLAQPSFVPGKAEWWIRRWIESTVHGLIDGFEQDGHAELNVDFCAAIPVLTITGSFGIGVADALDLRATLRQGATDALDEFLRILAPVVVARRNEQEDDLISVLVEAELTDEDGEKHRLSDAEIYAFSYLLLAAGSGTTWKQMGITLAALLSRPQLLNAVRRDRTLLGPAIEEAVRWTPTDPVFARFAARDTELFGTKIPEGSVLQLCLGAANRDPARWDDPDEYDLFRPVASSLAFGSGPHVCLGMHVARAEIRVGVGALLDRLPNLRLDPDAGPPQFIGMYERGPTELPVLFG